MLLKQKELDSIMDNNRLQNKIRENIIHSLNALQQPISKRDIKAIVLDLKSQNESQSRIQIQEENISKISTDFYERLLEQHPGLTKKDLELCSLIRLGLSSKEIASIRNTRENTVNVSKTRLRHKMDIDSGERLMNYLLGV